MEARLRKRLREANSLLVKTQQRFKNSERRVQFYANIRVPALQASMTSLGAQRASAMSRIAILKSSIDDLVNDSSAGPAKIASLTAKVSRMKRERVTISYEAEKLERQIKSFIFIW